MAAPRRHYTPEQIAFERKCEEKLLAELEATYAARRMEKAKANLSPIKLRSAIAKTINKESKQMPEDRRDGDITDRLLKHFRKNPPNAKAIAKAGDLPSQDVNQRMAERYAGHPLVSGPQAPTPGPIPATSKLSLDAQKQLSAMIKNRGATREIAAESEADRQEKIIAQRRNARLGLK